MGSFLAFVAGHFNWTIALLTLFTATFLQILSNLANDYGDSIHGADHEHRGGPSRAVQSGLIKARSMRLAIFTVATLAAVCGLLLLWLAFGFEGFLVSLLFLFLGGVAIWAAISYTAGSLPYGYAGLGDLAVFIFFGLVGVLGSYYLQVLDLQLALLLPATSCGLLIVAVLNVNNVRDIRSDQIAGKMSIPVRLGLRGARLYHWVLLGGGVLAVVLFVIIVFYSIWQFLFILTIPLLIQNGLAVSRRDPAQLDPYLKQLSVTNLLFVLTFGMGQILGL
jgi:1,4-dihydroxy-2-naphthoate octaprenyltransferase